MKQVYDSDVQVGDKAVDNEGSVYECTRLLTDESAYTVFHRVERAPQSSSLFGDRLLIGVRMVP